MKQQQPPATLNGYPVIAERIIDTETYAIICYRREHPYHPYVVAKWSIHSPNEWQHGSYLETLPMAVEHWLP